MTIRTLSIIGTAAALAACSDGTTISEPQFVGPSVTLSFSTRTAGQTRTAGVAPRFALAAADTLEDGVNTLILDQVQIVLREIELERAGAVTCEDGLARDDCEEFEVGPILVDLPLNQGTELTLTVPIDTGSFDEIEFEIHKVDDDDPEDAAFRQAHPDFIGTSIRVRGTYNGVPFTFETDVNAEQEFDLIPPLVIDDMTTTTNVTVRFDVSQWFLDGFQQLVDPASANKGGPNENRVKDNIENSIEAFGDDDRDGDDDHR